jgi:hypothetical protein
VVTQSLHDSYNDAARQDSKWLVKGGLRFTSCKDDRIKESVNKNAFLSRDPTKLHLGYTPDKLMKLRLPDKSRELAGQFKFASRN